jgi:hypothetical protein
MKNLLAEQPSSLANLETPAKSAYVKPVLLVYGSVQSLTKGQSGSGTDAARKVKIPSDRAIKENIIQVGTHPLGIGLYLFDYKPEYCKTCGNGRHFGVMADEVEIVMPEAVSVNAHGYKQVNYAMLGIRHNIH